MTDEAETQITASEVATYVVCPESWRLKRIHRVRKPVEEREKFSRERRGAWLADQDFSARLRRYAKTAYLLLVLVVITIFVIDQNRNRTKKPLLPRAAVPNDVPSDVIAPQ